MTTNFMSQPKPRQSSSGIADRRRAMELIRPFVPLFEEWNHRAARASALALSRLASAEERAEQARVLADLYREVDKSYEEFESTVASAPRHGRIDDLRAAFQRLRGILEHWRD